MEFNAVNDDHLNQNSYHHLQNHSSHKHHERSEEVENKFQNGKRTSSSLPPLPSLPSLPSPPTTSNATATATATVTKNLSTKMPPNIDLETNNGDYNVDDYDDNVSNIIHVEESDLNINLNIMSKTKNGSSILTHAPVFTSAVSTTTKIKGDDEIEVSSFDFTNSTNYTNENSTNTNQRKQEQQQQQHQQQRSPIVYPPPMAWYQQDESSNSPKKSQIIMSDTNNTTTRSNSNHQNNPSHDQLAPLSPLSFDDERDYYDTVIPTTINDKKQTEEDKKTMIHDQKVRIKSLAATNHHHYNSLLNEQTHRYQHDHSLNLPDIQYDNDDNDDTNNQHDHDQNNNNYFQYLRQRRSSSGKDENEESAIKTTNSMNVKWEQQRQQQQQHHDRSTISIIPSSPTKSVYSIRSISSNTSSNSNSSGTNRNSPTRTTRKSKHFYQNKRKKNSKKSSLSSLTSNNTSTTNTTTTTTTTLKERTTQQLSTTMKSMHTVTFDYLPNAAQELIYTSSRNLFHYTRKTYNQSILFGKLQFKFSEVGNKIGGYDYDTLRKEGIRDERDGKVLWSMDSIRDNKRYSHHLNDYVSCGYDNGDDIYNINDVNNSLVDGSSESCGMAIAVMKKKKKKKQMKQNQKSTTNSITKRNIDPMFSTSSTQKGFGWEDEWDRQRVALPPFSSLNWVDRQLVKEWRTCEIITPKRKQPLHLSKSPKEGGTATTNSQNRNEEVNNDREESSKDENDNCIVCSEDGVNDGDDAIDVNDGEDTDFDQARKIIPKPMPRPPWENAFTCYTCRKAFNSTRLRHHCRLCGRSYCNEHSKFTHRLPHLGYDPEIPERTCGQCKQYLEIQNLAERIAWRMARCRDYLASPMDLCPYFETGVDTLEDAALRLTKAAINLAKSIPLGAQATVAVETLDVLRKHGLKGIYGLILRKEFLAAADLLCRVTGINKRVWPLSVHELSAAIFYALAQHRALRGVDPEMEHCMHAIKRDDCMKNGGDDNGDDDDDDSFVSTHSSYSDQIIIDEVEFPSSTEKDSQHSVNKESESDDFSNNGNNNPVCGEVSDSLLASLIFYAPVAMNFIYATTEVDMQLLAAQQGWRLIYAHLKQDVNGSQMSDMPASALFIHMKQKIACFSIRGTATINDVVTDIRAMPVQFPDSEMVYDQNYEKRSGIDEDDWMKVSKGQGLALCGMAGAAYNLFRENIETLVLFATQGYRIRLVGHSLGGGVAALLGALVRREIQNLNKTQVNEKVVKDHQDEHLRVYSYGSPACVDDKLSDYARSYVTNCVLHDDVIPRLTPTSIRSLLKHLLYIRETWVKEHLTDDLMAITERAKTAWAPKLRNGFNLMSSKKPSLKLYKKLKAKGSSIQKKIRGQKKGQRGKCDDSVKDITYGNLSSELLQKIEGSIYDGEHFFEAEEDMQDNEEEPANKTNFYSDDDNLEELSEDMNSPAVILEEAPLPRMFIPGKIVHIYTHRGGYKIAQVPRDFSELRQVSLAGNMLSDHMSKSYYEALLECKSIRKAKHCLPIWTGFDEENTCACCASRFTWASTSDSEAQEARDKHNCRFCGCLVCDPCSSNRVPIPDMGLNIASRVCDRCYHDMGSALTDENALTRSFMEDTSNDCSGSSDDICEATPAKEKSLVSKEKMKFIKPKRSEVVDELILRMPSMSIENCAS